MDQNQSNKQQALAYWEAIDAASVDTMASAIGSHLPTDFCWKGPAPLGTITGPAEIAKNALSPLKAAIPDLKRQTAIFMGGQSSDYIDDDAKDAYWVAGTGYLTGTATGSFIGIPATDRTLRIRWSEFIRFKDGVMVESQVILDFVDWFDQIDLPVLPKSRGAEHVYPAPTGFNGVLSDAQNADETTHTLKLGNGLLYGALNGFDQNELASMGMADYFHPNLKWYGPGGIGACLSLTEFEQFHQQPWLIAFPDRKIKGIESLFAEGRLLAASGVAGVEGTHTGTYLNEPASGARIQFSGIDFWFRDGNQFIENWVFVDMIDLFNQIGIDLFDRMTTRHQQRTLEEAS